ncbi:tripartite motif-containing protein 16-like protein [Oryzias latipes]|uniref:Tripartite motif containing 16 n=1 Tax=Oryzias latipes TaxID=8090 RepID=A0A3B3IIG3_ORYLA|nr:tripartite motif-containing protein 16-like protein [Oryzias latipes]
MADPGKVESVSKQQSPACGDSNKDSVKPEPKVSPVKAGPADLNKMAQGPDMKSDKKQSQEPKVPEELKIQEDLKESEDLQKPKEGKQEKGPQTEEGKEEPLGPDDVVCDSCIENPRRAVKSCLTCLVSYCEAHLRPHLENPKFQNHRLLEPLRDIERRTCESHKWPLDLFCSAETCCICKDCVTENHKGHNILPVVEARRQIEEELKGKQADMVQTVATAESAINKLQVNTVSIEHSVTEVQEVIESQFKELEAMVEKAKREVKEFLEGEEKQALRQAEGIRVHLEQRCKDLKRAQEQMEKLSRHKNVVDFLQEYANWKKEAPDYSLPGVNIGLMDSLKIFSRVIVDSTKKMCDMLESSYIKKVKDTCNEEEMVIQTTVKTIVASQHNKSIPDPKTRADFLKFVSPVSFDPNTAHTFLRLTEENKKVTNTTPWQHPYPDVPDRFEHCRQVLASESFYLNRHYFEADISGEGTHIGLTYKSIERKGDASSSCITGNDFSWCIQWNGRTFSAWHSNVETPLNVEKFTRVGVYLDYTQGRLAFYGVDENMTLLHEFKAKFLEPLYPAFWLPKKENVISLVTCGEPLPLKSPSPPSSPATGAVLAKTKAA